jgi:hypothetical protein
VRYFLRSSGATGSPAGVWSGQEKELLGDPASAKSGIWRELPYVPVFKNASPADRIHEDTP